MIRLIGVLTTGGIPIKIKSSMDAEGELILGPLIEAAKALSAVIGSGEVRKLGFKNNTLIVTETKKGYTIVALVGKAEDYMDTLLRILADAIDDSEIPRADGLVDEIHVRVIDKIIGTYIRDNIEIGFPETISDIWTPILNALKRDNRLSRAVNDIEGLLKREIPTEAWNNLRNEVSGSLEDALKYALEGEYDRACAVAMDIDKPIARVFCIKMGALAHTMTKAIAPPLSTLREISKSLQDDYPFTNLARTLIEYISGERIPADYSRAFREAIKQFNFNDEKESLILGFLFLDPRVVDYKDFAFKIVKLYRGKSEVFSTFIETINERGNLFEKLYSITSYDGFRDELGVYKTRITGILGSINWVLDSDLLWELKKEGKGIEIGILASLQLQNYIAILTALTESPVLTIGERKEILEEVLMLYNDYFRGLMKADIPLFSYTIDSVAQSLSVANAEYYCLATGDARNEHLNRCCAFLSDIYQIINVEWPKAQIRFPLFVVLNALGPILTRADMLPLEEVYLAYLAMRLLDTNTIDATQITRPEYYATYLGNTTTTLTALASKLLEGDERLRVLKTCVDVILDVQEWFISHGVICRDDIFSASFHASLIIESLDDNTLEKVAKRVIALNRVAVQDQSKYDYEVAMIGSPLIEILFHTWKRLNDERYLSLARQSYDSAYRAWTKYGFQEKAENFKIKYGHVWR
ncbi:MAG: hypothetical protein JW779_08950 [Candidatus Thorarchaeota archaeon]|nr:hypothetical protein [Candidatus Thorarchaeota archaeon]